MAKHTKFTSQIIEKMGGKENINKAYHCFTRLRFTVFDESKIDIKAIEKIPGHLGIKKQSGQYQIIIGKDVGDVYKEVVSQIGITSFETKTEFKTKGKVKFKFNMNSIIDVIASLFTPILGVLGGAGIFQGLIVIFTTTKIVTGENAQILNLIGGSTMAILPILLAATAAKKFNVNIYLAMTIAGVLISPTIIMNISSDKTVTNYLHLWGMQIPTLSYAGAVFPSILMVLMLVFVERGLERILPKVIRFIVLPLIALVVMVPLTLIVFGPIGNYIGIGLAKFVEILFSWQPWIAGTIYGAMRPFIVIFGMHYAFIPVTLSNLASSEARDFLTPIHLLSNYVLAGGALGALLIVKNKQEKQIATAATISGLVGVTEPALYGIMLKNKMSFLASIITSGVMGGAVAGLQLYSYSFAPPSLLTIAAFFSATEPIWKFITLICLVVIAVIMSAGLTMLFGIDEFKEENKDLYIGIKWYQLNRKIKAYIKALKSNKNRNKKVQDRYKNGIVLKSLGKGKNIELSDILSKTIEALGIEEGYAINLREGKVYPPINGTIENIGMTKNSYIISNKEKGIKVLVHFGKSEEVSNLIKSNVIASQEIKTGDLLLEFDYKKFKKELLDKHVFVLITENKNKLELLKETEAVYVNKNKKILRMY